MSDTYDLKSHQSVMLELLIELDRICKKHSIRYILFAGSALGAVRHKGFIPWDDDLDVALLRDDYNKLMQVPASDWSSSCFMQREFSEHWPMCFSKLRKNQTTCLEKYHPKDTHVHSGIYIDIFPIDNVYDNPIMQKLQFWASRVVLAKALYKRGYDTNSVAKKAFMLICNLLPTKAFHHFATYPSGKHSKYVHSFFGGTSSFKKGIYDRQWLAMHKDGSFEGVTVPISAYSDEMLTAMYGDYMVLPSEEERKCKVHALLVDTKKNYTEYETYRDNMKFDQQTRSIR